MEYSYVVSAEGETLGVAGDLEVAERHLRAAWAAKYGIPVEEIPEWLGLDLKLHNWYLYDARSHWRMSDFAAYREERLT